MKHIRALVVLFCFITSCSFAQEKYTLSGTISDIESNETLIGVNILFPELQTGTATNEYGFFSITIPEGTYKVQISFLGFTEINEIIDLSEDITFNFQLSEAIESLDEVVITKNVERTNIRKPQMSVNALSSNTIKQIPVVLGEADVIKSITLLPGVTNAGEGSSGFNVRGGYLWKPDLISQMLLTTGH